MVGGPGYVPYGLIGATISILVGAGLFLGSDATFNRLQYKLQDFYVASPLPAIDYMLGLSLGESDLRHALSGHSDCGLRISEIDYVELFTCARGHAPRLDLRIGLRVLSVDVHSPEPQCFLGYLARLYTFDGGASGFLSHFSNPVSFQISSLSRAHDASLYSHAIGPGTPNLSRNSTSPLAGRC